ncbi:tandem-95 repeat protein, partial [Dickeya dadantii]|uniref:cadherin-like domain-containing protein n=1 Tax=Dickeya dadantii TaxID=204038 RepID=UPI001495A4E4
GGVATGTLTITVTAVNDAPVAGSDTATTLEDTPVTVDVLANDSDVDGNPLTVTAATAGHGTVVINADGTLTYTPNANFNGTDTVTYTVSDGAGGVVTGTLTITVTAVNDAPVAGADTATTAEDTPVTVDVLANDSDVDGNPLTVTAATAGNGAVVINADGTLTYTPNSNFNGTDTVTYTV